MEKRQAEEAARLWVAQTGRFFPGAVGAYLSGSCLTAPQGQWPDSSDVDVVLVLEGPLPPQKPGKFRYLGVLLEVTCLRAEDFCREETLLSAHYLVYALSRGIPLWDPIGLLAQARETVLSRGGSLFWKRVRCEGFFQRIRENIRSFDQAAPLHEQAMSWLFTTGLTCFPVLCAAEENCTVRKRYTAARLTLEQAGRQGLYEKLLSLLMPAEPSAALWETHLSALERTFWLAAEATGPSSNYAYRSDISPAGYAAAVGGCRELVASPYPREAAFWMGVTFARCQTVLWMDNRALYEERLPCFQAFLAQCGLADPQAFLNRLDALAVFLPELEAVTEELLAGRKKD